MERMENNCLPIFAEMLESGLAIIVILYDHKVSRLCFHMRIDDNNVSFNKFGFHAIAFDTESKDIFPFDV